jgi:hypothetical protein
MTHDLPTSMAHAARSIGSKLLEISIYGRTPAFPAFAEARWRMVDVWYTVENTGVIETFRLGYATMERQK